MKIAYTYQGITQKVGGVSRYFYEVCSRLRHTHDLSFILKFSENLYFGENLVPIKKFMGDYNFIGKNRIVNYLQLKYTKNKIENSHFDLIHHTGEFPQLFDFVKIPVVMTVHDMIPEIFYPNQKKRIQDRKICIEKSAAIICVSNNTKEDLLKIYPNINSKKVFVVHHGVSESKYQYFEQTNNRFILYVGSRYQYKNFIFFIESVAELLIQNNLYLYCIGNTFSNSEISFINSIGIDKLVVNVGIVNNEVLAGLYNQAECFVYPSLYEGFGIPILEAFVNNCPVCLSNTSCFPEIAGNAAVYFDPYDKKSIQSAIELTMLEKSNLINLGKSRLKEFSWDKASSETESIYNMVLKNF